MEIKGTHVVGVKGIRRRGSVASFEHIALLLAGLFEIVVVDILEEEVVLALT